MKNCDLTNSKQSLECNQKIHLMKKFLNVHSIDIAFMYIYKKNRKKLRIKLFSYIISAHTG